MTSPPWETALDRLASERPHLERLVDVVDQLVDIALDFRQSGHPGGSRSKVPMLVTLALSGAMRWDLRHPEKVGADRFVLAAGHTVPAVYALLAALHEALAAQLAASGDSRYAVAHPSRWALRAEDLLTLRRRGGLPGHAEFAGRSLFLKYNSGPSGHGLPAAAGMALALRQGGLPQVRVFALEGEGGATAGSTHETLNAGWGLGLENLVVLLDWNDFGIDPRPASAVVYGTPADWFASHGWRVWGAADGANPVQLARALFQATLDPEPGGRPAAVWARTRKGRGYGRFDHESHGLPHPAGSPEFWETKRPFQDRYGVRFDGFGDPPPSDPAARRARALSNLKTALSVLLDDAETCRFVAERLVELGDAVPERPGGLAAPGTRNPWRDPRLTEARSYPEALWFAPGTRVSNKVAMGRWGSWANSWARAEYGRPLFLALSADLAESTSLALFARDFEQLANFGDYERTTNPGGVLLPAEITEFTNAAMAAGIASVNFDPAPEHEWNGFSAAHSSYGAFAYLQYGPMRLHSQLAQDADLKVGPVLWVLGHSGPETAEDSRTHFGIHEPSVAQLFPEGQVCDLHPWDPNEVPVLIAAALAAGFPILALHLARPPVLVPDRRGLQIPDEFEAARGAYLLRAPREDAPPGGTVVVTGASTTANLVALLPEIDRLGLNLKIVAALSPQLFDRQPADDRARVLSPADRLDAMGITNRSRASLARWLPDGDALAASLCADHDDRWRTGGTVEEVLEEARLDPASILDALARFAAGREERLRRHAARLETLQAGRA
ncbi:MAG: transketolase [Acidobacteria bacterium]|nr:transketolase [Acidobacteriota bacterium]